ncbi:hypothetical protein Sj15T_18890 [Sphingobium sp. TA15]|uniref:Putative prophage MuMc02 nuclease n=1 Tax=Sphingobium indicum (strain DSM 16413 / CCM 7287 / MTCC 6362 / UT26 / NBRC 101211 / UT26S) TaxID=452662 RepID=D4Z4C1_SPHIU|nr:putative prophage MuMc02 nuclease [Sphingobium indicum UT26S]BDD66868.1 hypothetical protein Sj15T_18890 [Sphingobium sp. TA15]
MQTEPNASSAQTMLMYVTAASLSCRAEPKSGASVVEKLTRGDNVLAGETLGHWAHLDRIGEDCWVAQRFLSENDPGSEPLPRRAQLYGPRRDIVETLSSQPIGPSCGSKWKCGQMDSCSEAYHYLNECGLSRLDGDGDGVPCESIC